MKRLLFILALVCAPAYAQTNTARMLSGTNVVTTCPYTIQATDTTKLLIFNSASACAVSLPSATTTNFGAGAIFSVKAQGAGTVTITPATGTIDGAVSMLLTSGQGADIYSDGINYSTQTGKGSGAGGAPAGSNHDTQCNLGGAFSACVQNSSTLYVSTTGNDSNSGKTWDTAKLTIMAAVCALPTGNCSTTPKQAGSGTVYFTSGVYCNSNVNGGCWIAGSGDSQYPNMTGSIGGPTAWTIDDIHGDQTLNFICATNDTGTTNISKPFCTVEGPNHTVGGGYLPMFWATGNSLGSFYINGMSTGQFAGGVYSATWGRIGIDSATGAITGAPTVTQTASWTIENVYSLNDTGGGLLGAGPQLAVGNGFWMHMHDSGFGPSNYEGCSITSMTRTSNVVTVTTNNCADGAVPAQCPFVTGDHLSIRDTTADGTFNGTFTAASSCGVTNTVTFNQTGPNSSASVGSNGIIVDDRAFGIVCYSCQIEMARMHNSGGLKFYSGPSSNLQFNDNYIEGTGAQNAPMVWISPLIYGSGGLVDLSGQFQSDTPLLPSMINEGGPQVFVHTEASNSTNIRGAGVIVNGNDANNRTTGMLASGQSGWLNNQYFESSTDISRRQAPLTSRIFTNFAAQNPASWTGSSFTTTSGKRDPFGGTGAVEIDASAGTQPFFYSVSQSVNVGDVWYFGAWVRAASSAGFQVANEPFVFYIGTGNTCIGSTSQPLQPAVPFTGDTNWFWLTGSCTVWSTSGAASVAFGVALNASTPIQVYRPFVVVVAASLGLSATEVADEINSLGYGPSTQAAAGDITYPADKKICGSSGSATNEYCSYLTHNNTANRSNTVPDLGGNYVTLSSGNEASALTGQTCVATNASACSFASPGIQDGNGGSAITTTPYSIQCDSGTTLKDRATILRFQNGASAITAPLSTATGCAGGFTFTLVDDGAGLLTVNASSPDTFSVFDGGSNTDGATSFTFSNGQHVTMNQGASGIWEVRKTAGGVGSGASPIMGFYIGPNCPKNNSGQCFYTPADTQVANDCSWGTGSGVITCSNPHFTAADVGKSVMGGRTCSGDVNQAIASAGYIGTGAMPTITTFTSSTSVTISANPANAQVLTSSAPIGGCFIWGHIDDTGFSSLSTAVAAATQCPKVFLSAGYYLITFPPAMMTTNPSSCINLGGSLGGVLGNPGFGTVTLPMGFEVEGRGSGNTALYLAPNFPNGDSCVHTPTPSVSGAINTGGCFVIPVMGGWRDFRLDGGYQGVNANMSGKTLIYAAVAKIYDFTCINFAGYTGGNSTGLDLSYLNQLHLVNNSGCGAIGVFVDSGASGNVADRLVVESSAFNALASNGTLFCYYCNFSFANTSTLSPNAVVHINGGTLRMFGGGMGVCNGNLGACTTSGLYTYVGDGSANLYAENVNFAASVGGSTTNGGIRCATSCNNYISNSTISSQSGAFDYSDVSGSLFVDLGGNTWTPRTSISGSFIGESDSANNIAVTAPKLVLSANWGTSAAVSALTGGDAPIKFTITNGSASTGASPTITYTFPFPYAVAPFSCTATQVGGTNTTGTFTSSSLSVTGVTFTFSLTPTATNTEIVQVTCVTP